MKGKRRDMGLGPYPDVGLKEARQSASDSRRQTAARLDPIIARQAAQKASGRPITAHGFPRQLQDLG